MTLIRWANSPSLINEIDNFFNNYQPSFFTSINNHIWKPKFEVLNINESYIVRADLPGLTKKDVSIELSDNMVTISGERKNKYDNEKFENNYSEFNYGSFSKTFSLPEDSIIKGIDAKMKDGVLTVKVPRLKQVEPKTRKISIK
tara:strand:- start:475 stop:906 length:432 start_codon:yes stop_codon:yes gene_type:complete